jgi:hypothetical protein
MIIIDTGQEALIQRQISSRDDALPTDEVCCTVGWPGLTIQVYDMCTEKRKTENADVDAGAATQGSGSGKYCMCVCTGGCTYILHTTCTIILVRVLDQKEGNEIDLSNSRSLHK